MAAKIKVMKLLQELHGFAEVTNRRPPPRVPGLFLLQLRSNLLHLSGSKDKRTISIDMQARPDLPLPIKIKHLKPLSAASPSAPAP